MRFELGLGNHIHARSKATFSVDAKADPLGPPKDFAPTSPWSRDPRSTRRFSGIETAMQTVRKKLIQKSSFSMNRHATYRVGVFLAEHARFHIVAQQFGLSLFGVDIFHQNTILFFQHVQPNRHVIHTKLSHFVKVLLVARNGVEQSHWGNHECVDDVLQAGRRIGKHNRKRASSTDVVVEERIDG